MRVFNQDLAVDGDDVIVTAPTIPWGSARP